MCAVRTVRSCSYSRNDTFAWQLETFITPSLRERAQTSQHVPNI